ncbi:hypothetical protein [Sporisorium scitamineum]|uniref:Uncharacterized protein n=1 Tax=Sporisorium scitamineum TaxID=49012 RepID=A0A0F7RSA5_9BASI|nr:hypothetical protein [Sporisorium scitamineum]
MAHNPRPECTPSVSSLRVRVRVPRGFPVLVIYLHHFQQ